jgi:hypothetical protein
VPEIPPAPVPDFSTTTMTRVPVQLLGAEDARALRMDHRAGFVLSLVDGVSGVEAILDVCGMPRDEAMRILQELIDVGAIALR